MKTSSETPIHRHILLIGLMGCGKSTIGKTLSKMTGRPLLDTDSVIEEQVGMGIPDIFSRKGEKHFRALETALLRYLDESKESSPCIIATGGGIVVRPANRSLIRRLGFTVWLHAEVPVLLQRTAHANNRPLLQQDNPENILKNLLSVRSPFYRETAHRKIEVDALGANEIAEIILRQSEDFFGS